MPFGGARNEVTTNFWRCNVRIGQFKKQFGLRVRQIRDESDKTQEEFAEILGISVDF